MIITANGNNRTVNIRESFSPVFKRALKFITSMNGKNQVSDRGANSDKYECTFTVIGNTSDINTLVDDLYNNAGQILIDTQGGKIFGTGIDHSGVFTCNLLNDPVYPVRDLLTAIVKLKVRVVSPIVYDASITPELPTLFYQWPIKREVNVQKSNFDSIDQGDFGEVVRVDRSGNPIKSEVCSISLRQKDDEFGKLHRYIADQRGSTISINTNLVLELFLNSTNNNVKVKGFTYKPDGIKYWSVSMTLVNNV
jgi:hypothetical protein